MMFAGSVKRSLRLSGQGQHEDSSPIYEQEISLKRISNKKCELEKNAQTVGLGKRYTPTLLSTNDIISFFLDTMRSRRCWEQVPRDGTKPLPT
jgi:hypothetical protein